MGHCQSVGGVSGWRQQFCCQWFCQGRVVMHGSAVPSVRHAHVSSILIMVSGVLAGWCQHCYEVGVSSFVKMMSKGNRQLGITIVVQQFVSAVFISQ